MRAKASARAAAAAARLTKETFMAIKPRRRKRRARPLNLVTSSEPARPRIYGAPADTVKRKKRSEVLDVGGRKMVERAGPRRLKLLTPKRRPRRRPALVPAA